MTKKHYIIIAELIKENIFTMNNGGVVLHIGLVNCLLEEMKKDNPNFKEDIFLNACGLEWKYVEDKKGKKLPLHTLKIK